MMATTTNDASPLWRKICQALQDEFLDSFGYPATFRRCVNNGSFQAKYPQQRDTIWRRSVVCWHTWLKSEQNCIRYLRLGYDGDHDYLQRYIPQLDGLVISEIVENYCCDITAIGGMSSSRDSDKQLYDLDEFAQQCCLGLAIPVCAEMLNRNLSHHGLRISEMAFSQYSWVPDRLYWNNVDGAHHFAAARFQANQLGRLVPLTGQLVSNCINPQNVRQLTAEWDLFLVPANVVYGEFKAALSRVKCSFGVSKPPRWEDGAENEFSVIWLERDQAVPARVSRVLSSAGCPSLSSGSVTRSTDFVTSCVSISAAC
ncbi:hypothetical protein SB6412_05337 [Klebsiella pasteurii]|uniref:DUF6685 family protein n=1 Tax=Klebsiella pasteurii TaxID=2587529 RepID=UPI0011719FAE|nr:DUF6685 family protein [Klebsiella pasteurii]VUS41183.1 hypothetical protein SB6412_05337 [Klebsiella pasteurii]